jgi:hypothetical protein
MNRAERRQRKVKRKFGRDLCFACQNPEEADNLWDSSCQCIIGFKVIDRSGVQVAREYVKEIPKGALIIYEESR